MTTAPRLAESSTGAAAAGPRAVPNDRRNRVHLRELCDEVLASFRAARDQDVFSDGDRATARALLSGLTPPLRP